MYRSYDICRRDYHSPKWNIGRTRSVALWQLFSALTAGADDSSPIRTLWLEQVASPPARARLGGNGGRYLYALRLCDVRGTTEAYFLGVNGAPAPHQSCWFVSLGGKAVPKENAPIPDNT